LAQERVKAHISCPPIHHLLPGQPSFTETKVGTAGVSLAQQGGRALLEILPEDGVRLGTILRGLFVNDTAQRLEELNRT